MLTSSSSASSYSSQYLQPDYCRPLTPTVRCQSFSIRFSVARNATLKFDNPMLVNDVAEEVKYSCNHCLHFVFFLLRRRIRPSGIIISVTCRQFCSHRRHGQDKTKHRCTCRRCELGITEPQTNVPRSVVA